MFTVKIKKANGSEAGFEIKSWERSATGVLSYKKSDDSMVEVTLSENDIAYITDQSEFANTVAVYK